MNITTTKPSRPLSVRCPICGALPAQPCRNLISAREVRRPHLSRAEVATAAATTDTLGSFDEVVCGWDEPLRCQSVYGCRRAATWLRVNHKPCGTHTALCTAHYRRWVQACRMLLAAAGEMRCPDCDRWFTGIDAFAHFVRL